MWVPTTHAIPLPDPAASVSMPLPLLASPGAAPSCGHERLPQDKAALLLLRTDMQTPATLLLL